MGTHPIFESDFDCLTDCINMPETKKPETKREEFRKYLDQAGLLDLLTQFLVTLYEEPEKPTDAVAYMKKTLATANPDSADIETLKAQLEDVTSQLAEMKVRAETAESELEKMKSQSEEEVKPE